MLLMIGLLMLGFATRFVWGREYGNAQGNGDTIQAIEQKLTEPESNTLPT